MDLKLQTFNCFGPAYAPRLVYRTKLLCEFLKMNNQTDIVFLQEVWKNSHYKLLHKLFFKKVDEYQEIYFDELFSYKYKTGMVIYFKGRLLSKFYYPFSLNESNFVDRFRTRMGILKGVGYVKVECKKFGILHLLNVHTHPTSSLVRLTQIAEIIALVSKLDNAPVIMGGDFNMEPHSLEYQLLVSQLSLEVIPKLDSMNKDIETYSKENPYAIPGIHKTVDYIFLKSSDLNFSQFSINLKKYQGRFLSDHYGVEGHVAYGSQVRSDEMSKVNTLEMVIKKLEKSNSDKYEATLKILKGL